MVYAGLINNHVHFYSQKFSSVNDKCCLLIWVFSLIWATGTGSFFRPSLPKSFLTLSTTLPPQDVGTWDFSTSLPISQGINGKWDMGLFIQTKPNKAALYSNQTLPGFLLFPTDFLQSCEDRITISCQLSLLFLGPWLPQATLGQCRAYFVLRHKLNVGSKTLVTGLDWFAHLRAFLKASGIGLRIRTQIKPDYWCKFIFIVNN